MQLFFRLELLELIKIWSKDYLSHDNRVEELRLPSKASLRLFMTAVTTETESSITFSSNLCSTTVLASRMMSRARRSKRHITGMIHCRRPIIDRRYAVHGNAHLLGLAAASDKRQCAFIINTVLEGSKNFLHSLLLLEDITPELSEQWMMVPVDTIPLVDMSVTQSRANVINDGDAPCDKFVDDTAVDRQYVT